MQTFEHTIKDPHGMHARPAGLLVKETSKYKSIITFVKDDKEADAKRIFSIMGLGLKCAQTLTVKIEGDDEETASQNLKKFMDENI